MWDHQCKACEITCAAIVFVQSVIQPSWQFLKERKKEKSNKQKGNKREKKNLPVTRSKQATKNETNLLALVGVDTFFGKTSFKLCMIILSSRLSTSVLL